MDILTITLLSILATSFTSFIVLMALSLNRPLLQLCIPFLMSLALGALWGNAFFHLLPASLTIIPNGFFVGILIVASLFLFLVLEKLFYWQSCFRFGLCNHYHIHNLKTLFGDSFYNFVVGVIIAATYLVSFELGILTTITVALHETVQEISNFLILLHNGYALSKAIYYNFLSALTAIAGALIVFALNETIDVSGLLLPFIIGNFIHVANSNLVPILLKEENFMKSVMQFFLIAGGIAFMLLASKIFS